MRPRTRHVWMLVLAGAVISGIVAGTWASLGRGSALRPSAATFPAVGRLIEPARRPVTPVIAGTTLTRTHLEEQGLRGKVVLVNFWASWCAPCREEAPTLRRLAQRDASFGVRFVGVDIRDNRTSAMAFQRSYQITYPSIFDPDYTATAAMGPLAPRATPTTYLIDKRGRLAAVFFGPIAYNVVQPMLVTLTGEPAT